MPRVALVTQSLRMERSDSSMRHTVNLPTKREEDVAPAVRKSRSQKRLSLPTILPKGNRLQRPAFLRKRKRAPRGGRRRWLAGVLHRALDIVDDSDELRETDKTEEFTLH